MMNQIKNSLTLNRTYVFCLGLVNKFFENRVFRFILAGGSVAASQILVLFVLTHYSGLWYLWSSTISFIYALLASFTVQKFWVFRDRNMDGAWKQFVGFIFVAFLGLGINTASMYVLVEHIHIWYVVAQIITGALVAVVNFVIYKFIIFKKNV